MNDGQFTDDQVRADRAESQLTSMRIELERLRSALTAILRDPYGCPFCDSGTLRNSAKPHSEDCGFALAEAAISAASAPVVAPPEPLCAKCGKPYGDSHEFGLRDHAFKCDGNHGGHRCQDEECWQDEVVAPPEPKE